MSGLIVKYFIIANYLTISMYYSIQTLSKNRQIYNFKCNKIEEKVDINFFNEKSIRLF